MFSIHDSGENIFNVYSKVNIVQLTTFKQAEHERDILCSLMTSSMQPVTTTYRYMAETALFCRLSVCSISTGNAAVLRVLFVPKWIIAVSVSVLISDRIGFLKLDAPIIVYCLIFTILAQAATITVLIIVLHYFLKILLTFHFHNVLKSGAKVLFLFHTTLRCIGGLLVHNHNIKKNSSKSTKSKRQH